MELNLEACGFQTRRWGGPHLPRLPILTAGVSAPPSSLHLPISFPSLAEAKLSVVLDLGLFSCKSDLWAPLSLRSSWAFAGSVLWSKVPRRRAESPWGGEGTPSQFLFSESRQ